MKKRIKYKIRYAAINDIESITANTINMKAGKSLSSLSIYNSSLKQVLKPSDNGDYAEQTLSLKDLIDTAVINALRDPHIFELTLFDDTVFIWGSLDNPVVCINSTVTDGEPEMILIRKNPDFE